MQVPRFSPRISLIEMAPRAAPRSGCPGRPALLVTSSTGNGQWLEAGEESKKKTFALQEDHPDGYYEPPAGPVGGCLPWPPCPALFVTTDKQTPLLLLYIRCWYSNWKSVASTKGGYFQVITYVFEMPHVIEPQSSIGLEVHVVMNNL